jgi:hypothetical protein
MLKTIGGSAAELLTPAVKVGAKVETEGAKAPSLIVIISLIILLSAGMSFVMIRWRMEGRMIFLEDSRKTLTNDINNLKDAMASGAVGGGVAPEAFGELSAKMTALELALATSSQMIASNTVAIAALEGRPAASTTLSAGDTAGVVEAGSAVSAGEPSAGESAPPVDSTNKLCTETAKTVSGRTRMPIDAKYGALDILGQIFTAADCGEARLAQIPWLEESPKGGLQYSFGLNITLGVAPSPDLLAQLLVLGFDCNTKSLFSVCRDWSANKVMTVEDLKKLLPFVAEFSGDSSLR